MTSATSIAYHLRPNKVVDRELFVDLLAALAPVLHLATYRYVGLGGPFLEDFRLLRGRLGIRRLTCVERDSDVHRRQVFNSGGVVECVHGDLLEYIATQDLSAEPAVVWMDFTDPHDAVSRMEAFAALIRGAAPRSVLKLTLNASPGALDGGFDQAAGADVHAWRRGALEKRLGKYCPVLQSDAVINRRTMGPLLLAALAGVIEDQVRSSGRVFKVASSWLYADGQPMVTVAGVVLESEGVSSFVSETQIERWEFMTKEWTSPGIIDIPVLSQRERLALEQALFSEENCDLGFKLGEGGLVSGGEMVKMYKAFHRLFPVFARVDV